MSPSLIEERIEPSVAIALAKCELHYFKNGLFFPTDDYLLRNIDRIRSIPGVIQHGRYDMVCPMQAAWQLHQAWPEATFQIVDVAGHTAKDEQNAHALRAIMDHYSKVGRFIAS